MNFPMPNVTCLGSRGTPGGAFRGDAYADPILPEMLLPVKMTDQVRLPVSMTTEMTLPARIATELKLPVIIATEVRLPAKMATQISLKTEE